jgi:membrane-associated phospholipid phosphatase
MRRAPLLVLALALLAAVGAQPCGATVLEKTITYDPLWDTLVLGAGIGGAVAEHFLLGGTSVDFTAPDMNALSPIDAATLFPYHEGYGMISAGTTGLAILWPALFGLIGPKDDLLPAAAAYTEALSLTFIAKDLLKLAFPKARPYAYAGAELGGDLLAEADESFPSGHTALAFCAATSFAVLGLELAADNPATPWLVAGGYCLATATGVLRVVSGNHFLSDVAAGAALGTGIGWLVTAAHIRLAGTDDGGAAGPLRFQIGPSGVNVRLSL